MLLYGDPKVKCPWNLIRMVQSGEGVGVSKTSAERTQPGWHSDILSIPVDSSHFLVFPIPLTMLKCQASGPKTTRKKKKGNMTYSVSSFNTTPKDKRAVEDICVWNISTSEKTGRITGSRRNLKHYRQVSPGPPEGPSTSGKPGGFEETASEEDTGILADSESPSKVLNKPCPKWKRVRTLKENDSVSKSLILVSGLTHIFRQRWNSGFCLTISF